jgi:hypothetical protein
MPKYKGETPNPEDLLFGQTNPSFLRTARPQISNSELQRKKEDDQVRPDASKETFSPLIAVALETGEYRGPDYFIGDVSIQFQNAKQLIVVRAKIIEQDPTPHPDEKDIDGKPLTYDDGSEINPDTITSIHEEFVAASANITDRPNKGDHILVDFDNRITRTGPKYYGIKSRASKNAGAKKQLRASDAQNPQAGLQDTTAPPSGEPIPQTFNPTAYGSGFASLSGKPGLYQVAENGRTRPPDDMEMVVIEGTANLLYPKKYIRAFYAMSQAYTAETGKKLGVTSAYRDVQLQAQMYEAYLARNKRSPQVAQPGYSKHNNGRALDLATGKQYNDAFDSGIGLQIQLAQQAERSGLPSPSGRSSSDLIAEARARVASGEFGEVAKWLTANSKRFGFNWAGYTIKELWHYELDIGAATSLGLID